MSEQIAAVVPQGDGPKNNVLEPPAEPAENAGAEAAEQVDDEPEPGEPKRRLGGWQRKLIKAEQERDFWRDEALRTREAEPEKKQPADDKPQKPRMEDFTGPDAWEKYEAARDKYHEDLSDYKARKAKEEAIAEFNARSQQQKATDGWAQQCAEVRKNHADFDEVAFDDLVPVTDAMAHAVTRHKVGAEIAYYLGSNPAEAARISRLETPLEQVMAIGEIGARLAGKQSAGEEETETKSAAPPSRAPKPPTPVKRPSSTAVPDLNDPKLDIKEWLKARNAQLRKG